MKDVGTVLVTGGSSGLGAAVVHAVHEAGGQAVVLDAVQPRERLPAKEVIQVDLSDTAAALDAVERAAESAGGLNSVVAAAGTDACGSLEEVSIVDWERVLRVNLFGTAAVVRAALPYLRASSGRVVTVASTLGHKAVADATAYCASKFGVVGFTRALAAETAGEIGVTLLVPGGMRTRFFDSRPERYRPRDHNLLLDPARVADAVVYALRQPPGCQVRELVVCHDQEPSWP